MILGGGRRPPSETSPQVAPAKPALDLGKGPRRPPPILSPRNQLRRPSRRSILGRGLDGPLPSSPPGISCAGQAGARSAGTFTTLASAHLRIDLFTASKPPLERRLLRPPLLTPA